MLSVVQNDFIFSGTIVEIITDEFFGNVTISAGSISSTTELTNLAKIKIIDTVFKTSSANYSTLTSNNAEKQPALSERITYSLNKLKENELDKLRKIEVYKK
ncbi:MAG: hypothetical protein MHPSP_002560, partial [Paramarteilia canceri]